MVSELAQKLEVSERMVRVYKEELDKAGIYVDSIMGPYGGYVLNQSVRLPLRKFKASDHQLLDKYIKQENDIKLKNQLIILQDKIRGIYQGSPKEEKEGELTNETLVKFNILTRAIKEQRKVLITYYSYDKGENEVNVYGVFKMVRWNSCFLLATWVII